MRSLKGYHWVIGCRRVCRQLPPKFLHLAQSAMALMMDWAIFGVWILSRSAIFTRSRWKCPPFSCLILANSTDSSFVTHSLLAIAHAHVPPPTNQSFPSSIMYLAAWCLALFLSHSPIPLCIPSSASTTSWNNSVVANQSHRPCVAGVSVV